MVKPDLSKMKLDTGKAPIMQGFMQYFPRAIAAVANVSQFGFDKYGKWGGWRDVEDGINRYENALGRHQLDGARGEENCPESKQKHRAHRAWNALATLELVLIEEEAERGLQDVKDQSWADAANEPASARNTPEDAAHFERLKQDALARANGLNIDVTPRLGRDIPVLPPARVITEITPLEKVLYSKAPLEECLQCKTEYGCKRTGACLYPKKFTTCGKCDDINECGGAGRCFGR